MGLTLGVLTDFGEGAALADIDADGDLDLFVANFAQADELYWNNGSGTFTNSGEVFPAGSSLVGAWIDVDDNNTLDAFVLNDIPDIHYFSLNCVEEVHLVTLNFSFFP